MGEGFAGLKGALSWSYPLHPCSLLVIQGPGRGDQDIVGGITHVKSCD